MSYNVIVTMAGDGDLQQRFIACAAQENVDSPESWVAGRRWQLCTDQGAIDAYAGAMTTGLAYIGKRPDVITDGMVLSIVQSELAETPPPA